MANNITRRHSDSAVASLANNKSSRIASSPLSAPSLPRTPPLKVRTLEGEHGPVGAFSWPWRFFERQMISESWENSPWITSIFNSLDVEHELRDPDHENMIFFFKTEENWAPDRYRVQSLMDLFQGETLHRLRTRDRVPEDGVALLLDGNNTGDRPQFRSFKVGLSSSALLEQLLKKVSLLFYGTINCLWAA